MTQRDPLGRRIQPVISNKRLQHIKENVFEDETIPDDVTMLHAVSEDAEAELKPETEKEMSTFKKGLIVAAIAAAIRKKDRKEILSLSDWALISYDQTRAIDRAKMVEAASESWRLRTSLKEKTFTFNPNAKGVDTALNKIIAERVLAYNKQESKRLSVILREAKKQSWGPNRIAEQIKAGAGLNSRQQQTLYNLQARLSKEGLTKSQIEKKTSEYQKKALSYRATLTARYEAASAVNEGQAQLWNQLVDDSIILDTSEKEWWAILDNLTGTPDRAMNGQRVPINDKFVDPTLTHAPLMRPPLRGNCRCTMRLIPKEVI